MKTGIFSSSLLSKYPYMYNPIQLTNLVDLYRSVAKVPGCYVEVGCAYGSTTVFMKTLDKVLETNRQFFAIDTFSGFVEEHAQHDIDVLGMNKSIKNSFRSNAKVWLEQSLAYHGFDDVKVIEGDATKVDYKEFGDIAFVLLDVDLYLPIKEILEKIFDLLSPGAVIVVDDCKKDERWEGALVAFQEFVRNRPVKWEIVGDKLGVIWKPPA